MTRTKFTMTRKRADWVGDRKVKLRSQPIRPNERQLDRKSDEAAAMVRKMHLDVSKALMDLFDSEMAVDAVEATAQDANIVSQSIILLNKKAREWQKRFNKFSSLWSASMVKSMSRATSRDMKKTLEDLSGGMTIKTSQTSQRTKDIIRASSEQSASLIKTISSAYMSSVKEAVMRSITDDTQSLTSLKNSIQEALVGRYRVQRNKAKNVALDQTRKCYNALAESRAKDAGLTKYIWHHTSGSQKPRSYHRDVLDGKVFDLNDPPVIDPKTGERGSTGQLPNCKCYREIIVEFN